MLHKRHLPPKPTRPVGYCVKKRPPLPSSGFDNLPPGSSYRSVPPFSTLSNKASGTALATAGPASGRSAHLTSLLREAPSSAWADRTAAAANLFSIGPDCISIVCSNSVPGDRALLGTMHCCKRRVLTGTRLRKT